MGAHVSAVPNHQTGRITPIDTRAAVAFFGVFGYELDPTALTDADRAAVADQIAFYKTHRDLFQRGRFVRLRSPFEGDGDQTAWMVVAPDRSRAIVMVVRAHNGPAAPADRIRLRGLDPAPPTASRAGRTATTRSLRANAGVRGGDELQAVGLSLAADRALAAGWGDFRAWLFVLEATAARAPQAGHAH